MIIFIAIACFLCGSLMFSYWIGRLLKVDIRSIGDGNPGAANLWSLAGYRYGLLGVALDFLKGYVPIFIVWKFGLASDYEWVLVALAPIVGHAFSPFLKFDGGKGLAVSFGVWSALTQFRVSLCYAIILAVLWIITRIVKHGGQSTSAEDGLQTTTGFMILIVYLYVAGYPAYIIWVWLGNFLLLIWKNRVGLIQLLKDLLPNKII